MKLDDVFETVGRKADGVLTAASDKLHRFAESVETGEPVEKARQNVVNGAKKVGSVTADIVGATVETLGEAAGGLGNFIEALNDVN